MSHSAWSPRILSLCVPFTFMAPIVEAAAAEPVYPGVGWAAKPPKAAGMDGSKLKAFSEHVGGHGCVVREGHMVYTWGEASVRRDVASACKPWYTHFLLAAVESGKASSLDDTVMKWEPRLGSINEKLGHKDRDITWRHLANQTSCYGVAERPGEAYDYSDYNMALFFDTLCLKVYRSSWKKVDEVVLHPKLTDILQCQDDPTFMAFGTENRPGRLAISPRDFARFGLLYLRQGKWRDQQLLRSEHVSLATSTPLPNRVPRTVGKSGEMIRAQRSIGGGNNQTDHMGSYSFAWWTNGVDREGKRHWPSAPLDAYGAFGHGGPRAMVVIPSLDIVTSWNEANVKSRESENEALRLLVEACSKDP